MEIISATSSHSCRLSGSIPTNSPEYLEVKRGVPLPYQPWLQLQVVRRSPGLVKMVSQGINGIIGGNLLFPYVAHNITDVIHAVAIQSLTGKKWERERKRHEELYVFSNCSITKQRV